MTNRIAVETLTLSEASDLFRKSFEIARPKSKGAIDNVLKKLKKAKITRHKWIKTYEEFKGAKLNFYCEKIHSQEDAIVSIGMTHRTPKGLILITYDASNGGVSGNNIYWNKWVRIYTSHFCERFAERIMNVDAPTFKVGSEGIMFYTNMLGPVRFTDTIADGVNEIEFQFKEGQAYGYRDIKNKITYFRTVYSNDMLKHDRLDFKNEWKQPLDELYELFKWE